MAGWRIVAKGVSLSELRQIVPEMELTKGVKVRVIMDTWMPWAFDIAGAEFVFQPFVPDGLDLIDVYGENGQGIVDMEADPAWLVGTLAFIKAHWLAISIAGLVLGAIITFITVLVKVPAAAQVPIWLLVGGAAAIVGLGVITAWASPGRRKT